MDFAHAPVERQHERRLHCRCTACLLYTTSCLLCCCCNCLSCWLLLLQLPICQLHHFPHHCSIAAARPRLGTLEHSSCCKPLKVACSSCRICSVLAKPESVLAQLLPLLNLQRDVAAAAAASTCPCISICDDPPHVNQDTSVCGCGFCSAAGSHPYMYSSNAGNSLKASVLLTTTYPVRRAQAQIGVLVELAARVISTTLKGTPGEGHASKGSDCHLNP